MYTLRSLARLSLFALVAACGASGGSHPPGGDGSVGPGADAGAGSLDGSDGVDGGGSTTGTDGGGGTADGGPCLPNELCDNGVDDDCDGSPDDGCVCNEGATQSCYNGPRDVAGVGACRYGMQTCVSTSAEFPEWGGCVGETAPAAEVCDGTTDEDCDGTIDEGCGCTVGLTRDCYTGPASSQGVGFCHGGSQTCVDMGGGTADWGPCTGEVTPQPELCDGMDYDCDGSANTGCECALGSVRSCYSGPTGTSGVGICREGAQTCVPRTDMPGATWGPCTGEVLPETDTCDGIDHTCTGVPGAGCACILGATRACYGGPPATRGVGQCRDGLNTCAAGSGGAEWSATCAGETQPATETCNNGVDEDCDGSADEGCGGTIMCPGSVTVPAGQGITLSAIGVGISTYSWRIVSAPTGGAATAEWSPNPPTSASETFTPYIVGTYEIEISGTDAGGRVVTCRFQVTALPHGLRVQLSWDGTGDVDLHMHNGTTSSPWFTTNDCYYGNVAPAWGASLDFDNTSTSGPENISMDSPAIGMDYTIAVHNYARSAGRTATIQVFCGSTTSTVPTQTFTSRALAGTSSGNCSANDFWTVARVRFTSASTCTITPINTYRTSSTACTAF